MIEDVLFNELGKFEDQRGAVMHMLRSDAPFFEKFGEVYFSTVNTGVVKGWKKHLKMTQHITVPVGNVRVVIHDDRPDSPTTGCTQEFEIGTQQYNLLRIPPLVWYSFGNIGDEMAMVVNCTDIPHDPEEVVVTDLSDQSIPYTWDTQPK
ncbi:MAG: dTDP-4-dehydrorhamnose 3,5-epimerase [bacterium]|nr:dTDP-4-dehydrorhamnose 3,5-epimerase [bacterium]